MVSLKAYLLLLFIKFQDVLWSLRKLHWALIRLEEMLALSKKLPEEESVILNFLQCDFKIVTLGFFQGWYRVLLF